MSTKRQRTMRDIFLREKQIDIVKHILLLSLSISFNPKQEVFDVEVANRA